MAAVVVLSSAQARGEKMNEEEFAKAVAEAAEKLDCFSISKSRSGLKGNENNEEDELSSYASRSKGVVTATTLERGRATRACRR